MATRVIDPIGEAITATEKEIAGAAWDIEDTTLDETGDRTIEQMGEGLEGQHEPDDDDAETEGDESEDAAESEEGEGEEGDAAPEVKEPGEEKPTVKAEGEREGRVPSGRLREANERAKALEAERETLRQQLDAERAKSNEQIAALTSRFDRFVADLAKNAGQKPAEREATAPATPDFFEDPAGFIAAQTKPVLDTVSSLKSEIATTRFETSMAMAHSRHGDAFVKAFEASNKLNPNNPDELEIGRRIFNSPNPGEALVAWHKRNETLREVGDDPAKYRERIAAETRESLMKDPEFRKSLIDGLRAEASTGADGKPRTEVRLPKSLNGAAGGNRRDATVVQYDDNDQAIAEAAWR